MLVNPMDVLTGFPVRKSNNQKKLFRDAAIPYLENLGYHVSIEKGSFGCRNVVIGDPEQADYLVTAHYDTCAAMILPNFITPCNVWIYWAYQIGIVFLLAAASIVSGVMFSFVWKNAATTIALIVYWVLLMLMLFGPANRNNANDNTSGVITLLEIARTMPQNQRSKVCFVLFDLEEAGMIGSSSYRKAHKKATDRQLILNLDCVGDGDHIRLFPTKKMKKDKVRLSSLYKACGYPGKKSILVHEKGMYIYPSDQVHFPYGVGICALRKGKFGLYMGKIHTKKDTSLDINNVNILRAALTSFVCCDAAK